MKKAFFLDRDGVLNVEIGYLHEAEKTVLLPTVAEAVKLIHAAGFMALVVTNQSGVAKKMYPVENIMEVNARLQRLLMAYGPDALIDGWYFCPHDPEITGECDCRKPKPGMLLRAAADFNIDLSSSFMIGDRMSDINAGVNAGCAAECLVLTGYGVNEEQKAVDAGIQTAADLPAAVKQLLRI